MSTDTMETQLDLFEDPADEQAHDEPEAIRKIRDKFQGVEVTVNKGAQSKQLTHAQKASAAGLFGASTDALGMNKRLFDKRVIRRVEELRKISTIIGKIEALKTDRTYTLPHPEPGRRLLRMGDEGLDRMAEFVAKFEALQSELSEATQALYEKWDEVKVIAEQELGTLYNAADYNYDVRRTINASYKFVDIDVPSYLQHNPALYQREAARVRSELETVKKLKEAEMAEQMFQIIDKIVERLEKRRLLDESHEVIAITNEETGDTISVGQKFGKNENPRIKVVYQPKKTGSKKDQQEAIMTKEEFAHRVKADTKPKTFNTASVTNMFDALEHAKDMLDELSLGEGEMSKSFDRLRRVIRGQTPESLPAALRGNAEYREETRKRLERIGEGLLNSVVEKPRRAVLRKRQRQHRRQE